MAITQSQSGKDWKDFPDTTTPIMAADMKAVSKANRDYRWLVPTGVTSIDEFDDDTLDAAWTRVDGTGALAANATWTEAGDSLSVYNAGADTTQCVHGLMRPLTGVGGSVVAGDAFVTAVRLLGPNANFTMGGIILADGTTFGSGQQSMAMAYLNNSITTTINGWVGSGYNTNTLGSTDIIVTATDFYFRLVCITANTTWRVDASPDGISWIKGTNYTKAVTPTHIGVMSSTWGSTTKGIASYEFLRRASGVS